MDHKEHQKERAEESLNELEKLIFRKQEENRALVKLFSRLEKVHPSEALESVIQNLPKE